MKRLSLLALILALIIVVASCAPGPNDSEKFCHPSEAVLK